MNDSHGPLYEASRLQPLGSIRENPVREDAPYAQLGQGSASRFNRTFALGRHDLWALLDNHAVANIACTFNAPLFSAFCDDTESTPNHTPRRRSWRQSSTRSGVLTGQIKMRVRNGRQEQLCRKRSGVYFQRRRILSITLCG